MTEIGIATLLLIIANIFCSVQGLNDHPSFDRFTLKIDKIFIKREYLRLFTSGFFHVSWLHLVVTIATLCFFSSGVELSLGGAKYLLIYFMGLLGGNFFALIMHQRHGGFSSAGASGAVTAVVFATIALFPGFKIGFLGVHFDIPGWFYGFLYVLFSIYGIKSRRDNVGHEIQLAGGLAGLMMALVLQPNALLVNYLAILCLVIPSLFFIFIIIRRPRFIMIDNKFFSQQQLAKARVKLLLRHEVEETPPDYQQQIDLILEKIHQNGMDSLSRTELDKLDHYSKTI